MRNRKQQGSIVRIGNRWYLRFWERRNIGGTIERKRVSHSLGEVTTRGKHPPADIETEAERHMATVNSGTVPADRIVTVSDFVEKVYLPWIKLHKRPSTHKGYRDVWEDHLKATIGTRSILKDTRTFDCQRWLDQIAKLSDLCRNSLKHCKGVLSGIFTLARQQGYFDGANPVQGTATDPGAREAEEGYAYSLEEILSILGLLPEPAATAFAVAAFGGLRHGEIQGLDWTDVHDGELWVSRSVWNGQEGPTKTKKSKAPVPIIPSLARYLDMHRLRATDPETGTPKAGPIFANSLKGRLSLNNLRKRMILPTLNKCKVCKKSEGEHKLHPAKFDHKYERDESRPAWHGWHACRRGLASNLNRLGIDDSVIQRILRHSSVQVTQGHYIKTSTPDVIAAMEKIERELVTKTAAHSLTDTLGTVNHDSRAVRAFAN